MATKRRISRMRRRTVSGVGVIAALAVAAPVGQAIAAPLAIPPAAFCVVPTVGHPPRLEPSTIAARGALDRSGSRPQQPHRLWTGYQPRPPHRGHVQVVCGRQLLRPNTAASAANGQWA
jgi:hypothetical protein